MFLQFFRSFGRNFTCKRVIKFLRGLKEAHLEKVRFFLGGGGGGGGRAGALERRVIRESEHQKGRVIPLCKLFKGRIKHLFQILLMRIFVTLLSIFLTD